MLEVAEEELQLIQQEECYVLEQQKNQQKAERQRQISLMYRYEDEKVDSDVRCTKVTL